MARYGTWRPLGSNWASQPKVVRHDLVILHTMVGSLWGTDGYFRKDGYGGSESHFGVGHDGETLQWQDTERQAEANLQANPRAVSIETADVGPGFATWNTNDSGAVPAWTPAQIDRLVDLVAWICRTHGVPAVLVPDSLPSRRGIAFHRLGCDPYRGGKGEKWSSAPGKVCPGARRIAQIPGIVARVQNILNKNGDDMPSADEVRKIVREETERLALRVDVGTARDQILTNQGVRDTVNAPVKLPPEQLSPLVRRADLESLRAEVVALRAEVRALKEGKS